MDHTLSFIIGLVGSGVLIYVYKFIRNSTTHFKGIDYNINCLQTHIRRISDDVNDLRFKTYSPKKLTTCTRKLWFCAGHRLVGHESKCKNIHGHNYTVFITVVADESLDKLGRVVDFSVIKKVVGDWIDENWDHGFIAYKDDEIIKAIKYDDSKLFILDKNPTAENMAEYLFNKSNELLKKYNIKVVNIKLYETENCYAEYGYNYAQLQVTDKNDRTKTILDKNFPDDDCDEEPPLSVSGYSGFSGTPNINTTNFNYNNSPSFDQCGNKVTGVTSYITTPLNGYSKTHRYY